ncbi:MAG: TolC family protein, partial [Prevotella sp.]|nr:TolC family protein [Prevotella sp.]
MRKVSVTGLVLLLLASCGVYRPYSRPETETDGLFRDTTAVTENTLGLARMSWRELFTDVRLQTLIGQGLQRNTDLQVARLQIEEAEAALMNARLSYLPSLSLSPEAG